MAAHGCNDSNKKE
jgi:quinol monooxygenase YgiN